MRRPLPPLNALKAFEATARHLSFTKAAVELNVTPAALSHQIRGLEERLGVQLFRRRARGIELTDAARMIYPGIHAGFERMFEAIGHVDRVRRDNILVVSATPGFTVKWLVPRLHRFLEAHPDIDTRVSGSLQLADFEADGVDVAVRYLAAAPADGRLHAERLMTDTVLPLCSRRLVDGPNPLATAADLARHTLIHFDMPPPFPSPPTWSDWLQAAGVDGIDATRGLRFGASDHAIDAAVEGAGVALGYKALALNDLQAGRLVAPFGPELPVGGHGYHLVCPKAYQARPKVRAFRNWLFAEIEQAAVDLGRSFVGRVSA